MEMSSLARERPRIPTGHLPRDSMGKLSDIEHNGPPLRVEKQ